MYEPCLKQSLCYKLETIREAATVLTRGTEIMLTNR
jgi:hypothetical protein